MPEEGERRFPRGVHWLAAPVKVYGLYLALFAHQALLGVSILAVGMFLTWYFALARKPA